MGKIDEINCSEEVCGYKWCRAECEHFPRNAKILAECWLRRYPRSERAAIVIHLCVKLEALRKRKEAADWTQRRLADAWGFLVNEVVEQLPWALERPWDLYEVLVDEKQRKEQRDEISVLVGERPDAAVGRGAPNGAEGAA